MKILTLSVEHTEKADCTSTPKYVRENTKAAVECKNAAEEATKYEAGETAKNLKWTAQTGRNVYQEEMDDKIKQS